MNKSQLIDSLAARFEGNRKQAQHALDSVLDTITREVAKGEKVAITGFGSFEKRVRDARWVRNPRTGERIKAKKTAIPKFSAGADLKNVVSGAKKLPKLTLSAASSTTRGATGGTAKKTTAKKSSASSPAKKTSSPSTAKKSTSKSAAKKSSSSSAKKTSPAKRSTAKKSSPAKKTTAKKSSPAKKSTAKKSTAKKTAKKS